MIARNRYGLYPYAPTGDLLALSNLGVVPQPMAGGDAVPWIVGGALFLGAAWLLLR